MLSFTPAAISGLVDVCMFGAQDYDLAELMKIQKQQADLTALSTHIAAYPKQTSADVQPIKDYETNVISRLLSTPYNV